MRTIVLRFRDFDVDTIQEHETLLVKHKHVWWGWWKKKEEPPRKKELSLLSSMLDTKEVLAIGIFDRSTDRFFLADIVDCVFEDGVAPVLSPEPTATPSYYRGHRVPAWFKVTQLKKIQQNRFEDEFGKPPVGDHTLFPVHADEPLETINTASGTDRLDQATLLHLSDFHFGDDHGFPLTSGPGQRPVVDIICDDLENICPEGIGLLILTGDFTTRADANQLFYPAVKVIDGLRIRLGLEKQHVLMVPGNHDIPLGQYSHTDYAHEAGFRQFLQNFYGTTTEPFFLKDFELPDGRPLRCLGMHSVRLRRPELKEFGWVEWKRYETLLRRHQIAGDALQLAILHHHLVPALREEVIDSDFPQAAVSVTLDAGAIIEGLQEVGFNFVLHGHQHVPKVTSVARGRYQDGSLELKGLNQFLHILAAGSVGAKSDRLSPESPENTYSLIKLNKDAAQLQVRRFTTAGIVRDQFRADLPL